MPHPSPSAPAPTPRTVVELLEQSRRLRREADRLEAVARRLKEAISKDQSRPALK